MYEPRFNQQKALRFQQFSRKGHALFACLGRVVIIGVLSVATLASASAAIKTFSVIGDSIANTPDNDSPDKEATLDDIEVTGSHAPLALGQAARMVTVLTRDEIQAAPVQSINDLLKMAVGVDVRQRGPIGAQTDVSIRGGTSEQIAILLNGINICDPQTGHNAFDFPCDLSDIERIEVLEGPAARVFGTSSLVGAINVVTTSSPIGEVRRGLNMRLESGSFGYLSTAGRAAISSHSISASYTRSDGYSRSKAGYLNSDYNGIKAFYQSSITLHPTRSTLHWYIGLSTKGFGSNTFYSAKFDEQYERTAKLYTALQGELTIGKLHIRPAIYWNYGYDRFELIRDSEEKVPFNYHCTDVFGVNLNSYFDWQLGRTAFGAEFRNEDIVSTNLGEPLNEPFSHYKYGLNRSNLSFHLEHNILLKNFTLSTGFIAIKNTWNEMSFTLYPGMDASYRIGNHWKVYASYNESLRMPSFTELYYSVGGHQADKYLKPEKLRAVEGGVKYTARGLSVKASIFHHHARHMIDWVMDTREVEPVWQSVNHTKVNTLGQEISLTSYLTPPITISLAYCHLHQQKQEIDYLQSQYSLEYLRHKLTASVLFKPTEYLEFTINYRYQDRMGTYTNVDGEVSNYHPYSVIDARLAWKNEYYTLYLEGNNLTNHRYVDHGNVPQPTCWVMLGAKYKITNK